MFTFFFFFLAFFSDHLTKSPTGFPQKNADATEEPKLFRFKSFYRENAAAIGGKPNAYMVT
jgi:hypothetical protein